MMKKKLLLFCLILFGTIGVCAETWTPVGQVQWTEGALTGQNSSYNRTWNVSMERSDTRPQVFRLQPYSSNPFSNLSWHKADNVYVYLHTENPNQVYLEYYIYYYNSYNIYYYHVWQRCPENGFDSKYYGKIIDDTTIEFPIGSFAVDEYYYSSGGTPRTAPSSYAKYSTYIHKIVFPEGILDAQIEPETFVNVGKGQWEDCFFNSNSEAKEVTFERSMSRTDVFRTSPYNYSSDDTPVLIHTEDPSKVWIESFTANGYRFTQQCSENDVSASKYGTMTNGRIEIPSDYFNIIYTPTNQSQTVTGGTLIITLPEGYNTPIADDNGIFMGIISFNDEINNLPITVLNQYTEPMFIDFVDNMEMKNATLLYYAVDQAITTLGQPEYPDNLTNAVIITFTDGIDRGSLGMAPEHRTSTQYAQYLADRISSTQIQDVPLQAYIIGLEGSDVEDEELFMHNLASLSSKPENALKVEDIDGVQAELTNIYEDLYKQTSKRAVSIKLQVLSDGDICRFTLDNTTTKDEVNNSKLWIEGTYNIDDNSLNNITYHGLTSSSGDKIFAERNGVYITFTFDNCRDENGEILEIEIRKNAKGEDEYAIDQWVYVASKDTWEHNSESISGGGINIEDIRTSAAIMFVLDCSGSLGDLFPLLKETANTFIDRLAGGDGNYKDRNGDTNGIENVTETVQGKPADNVYYDLMGNKHVSPKRGLYILNGRKVIVK